jgi:hypothetical protein
MEATFLESFKVKDGLGMSGCVDKAGVGMKMIAFNNAPIPMTVEGFERKNMSVVFTVINTVQEGFSRVPYENVNGKTKVSLCFEGFSRVAYENVNGKTKVSLL